MNRKSPSVVLLGAPVLDHEEPDALEDDGLDSAAPLGLAQQLAAGSSDPRVLRWAVCGFRTFLRAGGQVPLERCLGLATTPASLRRMQRDAWLVCAAREIGAPSITQGVRMLATEYRLFLERGPWRAWRELQHAPNGSSRLRFSLFEVARANDGQALSEKQIGRIVGHVFTEKCPAVSFTISPSCNGAANIDERET